MESRSLEDHPIPRGQEVHSHAPKAEEGLQRHCVTLMKEAARTTTDAIPQIYTTFANQLQGTDQIAAATLLPEASLSSSLYRARRSQYPVLPQTLQGLVDIPAVFANIGQDVRFLLSNTLPAEHGHLLFAADVALEWLADNSNWHVDGTFKASPRLFTQLFTVQVRKEKKTLPCAYCLLVDKRKQSYKNVFRALKDAAGDRNLQLVPTTITVDFELGLMKAIRNEFPTTLVQGCLFHFTQAVWRNIQACGLGEAYKHEVPVKIACRQLMALPFLPVGEVAQAFAFLEDLAHENLGDDLEELFAYFNRQWMTNPDIPLATWNCHAVDVRTNNAVEGFHSRLNRMIGRIHPNCWFLFEKLQEEQNRTRHLLSQIQQGTRIRVDVYDFLEAVGNLLHF